MPKIYVINKGCHDYSKAQKFGDLTFLSDGVFNRFSTGKIFRTFSHGLQNSSEEDLILISGLTVMASIACAIFARKHGRLNLLLYTNSPKSGDNYVRRTIIMEPR